MSFTRNDSDRGNPAAPRPRAGAGGSAAAGARVAGRGLTIVEAAMSVVIVAVVLVAALQTLGAAARARAVQAAQCQAPALARLLMAEIRQARYADDMTPGAPLGPDANEINGRDRTAFDDVDDYNGLVESSPRNRDGSSMSSAGNWQRQVTVEWVLPLDPAVVVATDYGLKRITVTVTGPGPTARLVALRSKYGGYDLRPHAKTTYVAGVGIEFKTGGDGRVYSGTNLANQVAVP
jgi:MSHA pilin protein MshD